MVCQQTRTYSFIISRGEIEKIENPLNFTRDFMNFYILLSGKQVAGKIPLFRIQR